MIHRLHQIRRIGSSRKALLSMGLCMLLAAGHANAGNHDNEAVRKAAEMTALRNAVARGEILPLPRIMALAQAKVPGDVVKTELEAHRDRLTYEVKILTAAGRVREVKLDARTGAVYAIEDD